MMRETIANLGTVEIRSFGPARRIALAALMPAARTALAWYVEIHSRGLAAAPLEQRLALATAGPALEALEHAARATYLHDLLATTRLKTPAGWVALEGMDTIHPQALDEVLVLALVHLIASTNTACGPILVEESADERQSQVTA